MSSTRLVWQPLRRMSSADAPRSTRCMPLRTLRDSTHSQHLDSSTACSRRFQPILRQPAVLRQPRLPQRRATVSRPVFYFLRRLLRLPHRQVVQQVAHLGIAQIPWPCCVLWPRQTQRTRQTRLSRPQRGWRPSFLLLQHLLRRLAAAAHPPSTSVHRAGRKRPHPGGPA